MKRGYLLLALTILTVVHTYAQRNMRLGYIDMEYILENVNEYQEASGQLENRVQHWKAELDKLIEEIEQMNLDLRNERVLLTHELVEERKEEIAAKEDYLAALQQKRFGSNGDYFTQRRQLIQPIQDQVYAIVQELAESRQYDFIFDKTSNAAMLFAAERHDISDLVLRRIERASNRKQATSKDEVKAIEHREALTDEQDKALTERERDREARLSQRQRDLDDRQRSRDSIQAARKAEYDANKQRALQERKGGGTTTEEQQLIKQQREQEKEDREAKNREAAQERIRVRDSIQAARKAEYDATRQKAIDERERKRDSISNARKKPIN